MTAAKEIAVVTGGAGFIGSHMVDLLVAQGFEVRVIDNLVCGREENIKSHLVAGDATLDDRDIRALRAEDPLFRDASYVFHFAGIGDIVPSIERPSEYMDVNVQGTVRVLEAARRNQSLKKFVYAASSSCYGITKQIPTTEEAPIIVEYPYALSKYQGEQAVLHWGRVYDLPVASVRIFNAYGTRSRTTGAYGAVFGVFLKQKLAGKPFTVVGDGTQTRDFIYASDVANGFFQVARKGRLGEVYNVGAGNPQSVNHLVTLLGKEVIHIPKRPGEPDCTFADISKIVNDTGWQPEVSFEAGVEKILNEIDYWRDAPLWTPELIERATASWFKALDK